MTPRILVTRSQPGAQSTAAALSDRGYKAIVEPLISVEPIDAVAPEYDALAFTSVNGVRRFQAMAPEREVSVWCVGERTAAEARAAGYRDVRSADGDVSALAAKISDEVRPSARILHAGNEESRGDLVGQLRTRGFSAILLPVYRTRAASDPGPELARMLSGENAIDGILVHSPKAAAVLAGFLRASPAPAEMRVAAISQQAVLKLSGLVGEVAIANSPNEDALLAALDRLFDRS